MTDRSAPRTQGARRSPAPEASPTPAEAPDAAGIDLGEELGTLLGRARRLMRTEVEQEMAASGQELLHWLVLRHLVQVGPSSQVALAEAAAQDPAQVSRGLSRMQQLGLVGRTRDESDRRRQLVVVTAKGRRLFASLRPLLARGVWRVLRPLSQRELQELRRLLAKVVAAEE